MDLHVSSAFLYPPFFPASDHISLKISLNADEAPASEKVAFPFLIVSDSDPLTRTVEAKFVSGGGTEIRRIFLLVQRDRYLLKRDELRPVHNPDIDRCWQNAFSFYSRRKKSGPLALLSGQIDDRGTLLPFQSLFFCLEKKIYFAPPCPSCGSPLVLCRGDELLSKAGLQPYSSSIQRYLFCPECSPPGRAPFFACVLGPSDPSLVRDLRGLIQGFDVLLQGGSRTGNFPCASCPGRQDCYASGQALSRIVPFSFYPFYALLFEASSLNAWDFIFLLSGAGVGELENNLKKKGEGGRIRLLRELGLEESARPTLLFPEEDRFFLEVLYLKLTFLGELIHPFLGSGAVWDPSDLRLSLDQVWINLEEPVRLLPYLWNFRVRTQSLYMGPADSPNVAGYQPLFSLGMIWLYTLLVNNRHDVSTIYHGVRKVLQHSERLDSSDLSSRDLSDPIFLPENIFWNSEGKKVNPGWSSLWQRSLHLGALLLEASREGSSRFQEKNFLSEFEALSGEVRSRLFAPQPAAALPGAESENEAVRKIIRKIIGKWRMEAEKGQWDPTRTFICPPGDIPGKASARPPQTDPKASEALAETVIFSPDKLSKKLPRPADPLAETVILSSVAPEEKKSLSVNSRAKPPLEERGGVQAERENPAPQPQNDGEDDFLSETVFLGPEKLKAVKKKLS